MKLYSYVVARDYGFAPNPFFGYCTLATCKPKIRKTVKVGDWIVGTGSKPNGRDNHVVYVMQITETMSFNEYWNDPRFQDKKPSLHGSKKQAFGDNIYHKTNNGFQWLQEDSHHSLRDGTPNPENINNDTQTDRVLVSDDFIYWGGCGPKIPKRFRNFSEHDICGKRGHKSKFPGKVIDEFVAWIRSSEDTGYCGTPLDWLRSP